MTTREEKLGRIKQQIAKAVGEIEHGDHAAAEYALAEGLIAVVSYLEAKWSELAAEAEQTSPRRPNSELPSVREMRGIFNHEEAEQKSEAPTEEHRAGAEEIRQLESERQIKQQQERFVASLAEQKPEPPTKIKRLEKK